VLNGKYEALVTRERKYDHSFAPSIDFANYVGRRVASDNKGLYSLCRRRLTGAGSDTSQKMSVRRTKKMLLELLSIIRSVKISDASAVLHLSDIHNSYDFIQRDSRRLLDAPINISADATSL
jgi:hypothetical protein